jgi:hypothetical protein
MASLTKYPSYTGPVTVTGSVLLTQTSSSSLTLFGFLSSSEVSSTGGLHVHSVTNVAALSCSDAVVGGHYYEDGGVDVWATTDKYTTDATGATDFDLPAVSGFTVDGKTMPVAGRAVVVHDSAGNKVACGMITVHPRLSVARYSTLPGYTGALLPRGIAVFEPEVTTPSGLSQALGCSVIGAGMIGQADFGAHIHAGSTCEDPQGHLYDGEDGWGDVHIPVTGSTGGSKFFMVDDFTFDSGPLSIEGRVSVLHDAAGAKVGCGVMEEFGMPVHHAHKTVGMLPLAYVAAGMSFSVLICVALFIAHERGWLGKVERSKDEENVLEMLKLGDGEKV